MKRFKAHILIVDDDDRIRELVKQYLIDNDYLVTTANSAEDTKKKVDIIKFDLIVLDIMMPGQSGLDFTNENKKKINIVGKMRLNEWRGKKNVEFLIEDVSIN